VKLIGSGRDDDYGHDGFSHYAGDDDIFINNFENIKSFWPDDIKEMKRIVDQMIDDESPYYLNLKR